MAFTTKFTFQLAIAFIIFLALVILTGRILYDINQSSTNCKNSDPHIQNAHAWAAWGVGISSAGAGLALIGFILVIVLKKKVDTGTEVLKID